jgi:hypothetical protein
MIGQHERDMLTNCVFFADERQYTESRGFTKKRKLGKLLQIYKKSLRIP